MGLITERFIMTGVGWNKPSHSSQITYRNHISQFEIFLKSRNKMIQDGTVTELDISDYIRHLRAKYKQNTIYGRIAVISSYFKWLKKEKMLIHIPRIQSQKRGSPKNQKLSNTDLNTIIQNMSGDTLIKKRDLAMFLLSIYCGLKTSQVVAIDTESVDFTNAKITIKNRQYSFRAAFTEMQAYVNVKIESCLYWKREEEFKPFFLNKNGRRLSGRGFRRKAMKYVTKIGTYNMRDLRHTYLENISKTGGICSIIS